MKKQLGIIKKPIKIIYNDYEKEDSEPISPISIFKPSNNLFNNINEFNRPFPRSINLLDNYNYIHYNNIIIPRLTFSNEYQYDKYNPPSIELFGKMKINFPLTKDHISKISNSIDINNFLLPYNSSFLTNNITHNDNNKINNEDYIINTKNDSKINQNDLVEIDFAETKNDLSINDQCFENTLYKSQNKNPKITKKLFNLQSYDINNNLISKKRGRKSLKKEILHVHTASDDDNILRKIQVHFLTFLVSFTNDYIDALFPNVDKKHILYFRHFDYKLKKIINHNSIEKMKTMTIGDILQMEASPKNKTCARNINQIVYIQLCQQHPELNQNYFNKTFKEFFIQYYYNKNERTVLLNGLNIKLSNKTRSFNNLIQKNKDNSEKFRINASYFYMNNKRKKEEIDKKESGNEEEQMMQKQKPFFIID
jgi:hypothetical protein